MLTRLKVNGFKNLQDVDVRFGPFTCVAGPNGVGKSNLFDAIHFLSLLAEKTFVEAAAAVRGVEGRMGDVATLFRNDGGELAEEMSFEAEMIIPERGTDELGAPAEASHTFLVYTLRLRRRSDPSHHAGPLELTKEEMRYVLLSEARDRLGFEHTPAWRRSVVKGRRTTPYIHTENPPEVPVGLVPIEAEFTSGIPGDAGTGLQTTPSRQTHIKIHADTKNGGGGSRTVLATTMPRTALSTAHIASEYRTLVLARKEMMGWTQFQLEPSALRAPDPFSAPRGVAHNGAHLPATLRALAFERTRGGTVTQEDVYSEVANRLSELFEDVKALTVEEDPTRELYSIVLQDMRGGRHRASALSDGTLRFLALTILEASAQGPSLLCLEEPENGIHPVRLPAMIALVEEIAVRVDEECGPHNPLRQVLINTHSPSVVALVPNGSLVLAQSERISGDGQVRRRLTLRGLEGTWRHPDQTGGGAPATSLIAYGKPQAKSPSRHRVRDREDVHQLGIDFNVD